VVLPRNLKARRLDYLESVFRLPNELASDNGHDVNGQLQPQSEVEVNVEGLGARAAESNDLNDARYDDADDDEDMEERSR